VTGVARAAVLAGVGRPLEVHDDVTVAGPRAGEVTVRMAAAGVCHSDLSMQDGTIVTPLPVVLGHEGAGVVEEVGEGVTAVAPGDRVMLCWVPHCGTCFFCARGESHLCERATLSLGSMQLDGTTRLSRHGAPVYQMLAAGTFSERTTVPATSVVPIPDDVGMEVAALMGCGVLTGVGAALNTADIAEGDVVAVVGCGGVGLNVIQGARIRGAAEVVAVDVNPARLATAGTFGATAVIDAGRTDPVGAVMGLTGQRGADVAFEVIGLAPTIEQTVQMTRRGGQAVLVGVPRMDVMLNLPAFFGVVLAARTVKGCWFGSTDVGRDVPRLIELYRGGRLKLDELVSRTVALDDVNEALRALQAGEGTRTVICF
jgi:Zn-dependent alcohol dehydrogenase